MSAKPAKHFSTAVLTKIAILSAVSFLLMFFEFSLPFLPSFYKLDFSEIAVMIGGFALGPSAAAAIEGLKIVLNLLFQGTTTAYVGEIANFMIGCAFCVPAAILYRRQKSKKTAIQGMIIGSITMILAGGLLNAFVLLPAYSFFYHLPMAALISMGTALIPAIHDRFTFILLATIPFNLLKAVTVSLLTMLLYKHLSPLLHRGI